MAERPDQLWVTDMTHIPTWAGFIYLEGVLNVLRRAGASARILAERMTAELVLAALNMALEQRRPDSGIHHSDQGCQYTSIAFGRRYTEMGVRTSMGSRGDAYYGDGRELLRQPGVRTARPAQLESKTETAVFT